MPKGAVEPFNFSSNLQCKSGFSGCCLNSSQGKLEVIVWSFVDIQSIAFLVYNSTRKEFFLSSDKDKDTLDRMPTIKQTETYSQILS